MLKAPYPNSAEVCAFLIMLFCNSLQLEETNVNVKSLFATKTPFKHHVRKPSVGGLETRAYDVIKASEKEKCKSLQINHLFRHGIRNPGSKDIIRAEKFFEMIKDNLTPENGFLELPKWFNKFPLSLAKELSVNGSEELFSFGKQYGKLLPNARPGEILFITSSTNRTRESCYSFLKGFNEGSNFSEHLVHTAHSNGIECIVKNDTLRFFDECKYYLQKVEQGYREYQAFQHGNEIGNIISNFKLHWNLNASGATYKELKAAYATAGTEVSTFGSSPWLELFSREDLEVLEYASDLKGYWKKGYGDPINFEQSCVLLREIFQQLDGAVNSQNGTHHKAVFRFGHSETLLPLICLMGLYKDETPLRADNFQQNRNRHFKAGFISPFAANLGFILYGCENPDGDSNSAGENKTNSGRDMKLEFELMLLHNEKPIHFPCCPDEVMCPYHVVRDYYSRWIDHCDFEKLCNRSASKVKTSSSQSKEEL